MSTATDAELYALIDVVSEEFGLPEYYRECVRPLVRAERHEWPSCCGGSCEPCMGTLVAIADRVLTKLGR